MQRDPDRHERWLTKTAACREERQPLFARGLGLALAILLLAVGCTEPAFGMPEQETGGDASLPADPVAADAATGRSGDTGAAMQTVLPPPAWAKPLVGDYAMRLRIFGREANTGALDFSHEQLSVVKIAHDASTGQVLWRVWLCRDYAELPLGVTAGVVYPLSFPMRELRVIFDNGEFHTEGDGPQALGYVAATPAGCAPGLTQPRKTSQSWLIDEGTCDCPPNPGMPRSRRDCRVVDTDQDNKPGFSVGLAGTVISKDYCVSLDDSQVQHGLISADQHHSATYLVNQDSYQLECAGGGCTRAALNICQSKVNTVVLAPLPERADGARVPCEEMLRAVDAGGVLPGDPLKFPEQGC